MIEKTQAEIWSIPVISAQLLCLFNSHALQTYVNMLNVAEEKNAEALAKKDLTASLALQPSLKFNGGGHINHSIFWTNLAPIKNGGGEAPTGMLMCLQLMQDADRNNYWVGGGSSVFRLC